MNYIKITRYILINLWDKEKIGMTIQNNMKFWIKRHKHSRKRKENILKLKEINRNNLTDIVNHVKITCHMQIIAFHLEIDV